MRTTQYNQELLAEICQYISTGLTNKDAATMCGISESTFYLWQSDEENNPLTSEQKLELLESIKRAKLKRKQKFIGIIEKAADKHWQAAAWYLERAYFDEFGRKASTYVEPKEDLQKMVIILPSNGREKL